MGQQNTDIDKSFVKDGKTIAQFKSEISVEDQTINITIDELYDQVIIDKEYYEDFKKVINAAAEFNTAVVLLEKK